MAKNLTKANREISGIYIRLASPDKNVTSNYLSASTPNKKLYWGEITRVETLNYRTYKPEMGGLFCEKIFGPIKDWECHCGKYKSYRYNGIVCDKCGVEVTDKSVRRERMGYIQLAVPVAHVWYSRSLSNKIGILVGLNSRSLEEVIYYEKYVVIQAGDAESFGVKYLDLLNDEDYCHIENSLDQENSKLDDSDPKKFIAKMGSEALEILLKKIDIDKLYNELKEASENEKNFLKRLEIMKKLKLTTSFKESNKHGKQNRPEWMLIRVVPVVPADLRPMIQLDGGKLATSDLNELYRKIIIRNERLKKLIADRAPEIILRNEKRMLQEAVDALIDKPQGKDRESKSEYKSISDNLRGKQGLFRQNLAGKRVDFSGRSVIVVGPELKLHECGLPKEMALELFKPFVIRKLLERRLVETVKFAKKMIAQKSAVIWEVLESVLKGHPVLLNRAPTLHRISIQAFQPVLVEGKAIQLHPLVCAAFNADFDGDQMAVHVPLSIEAIVETSLLVLSSQNIFAPSNGKAITLPYKDMVLGIYYITKEKPKGSDPVKGDGQVFASEEDAIYALEAGCIHLHSSIDVRIKLYNSDNSVYYKIIKTTPGRLKVNQYIPRELGYLNEVIGGKKLQQLVSDVYKKTDTVRTVTFLDDIKKLGFESAYKSGIGIGLNDIKIPKVKTSLIASAQEEVDEVFFHYISGLITENERYNKVIDIWTRVNGLITAHLMKTLETDQGGFNPLYMMVDSGARGSREQIRQIGGIRGLMTKPQKSVSSADSIIETPILSNFKEGLDVIEYFISAHGARKGLADTALKTADAGYLTRRVVEVCQNVVVTEEDCGTVIGVIENHLEIDDEIVEKLHERIFGRISNVDIINPENDEIVIPRGKLIDFDEAKLVEDLGIRDVEVRSIFTCLSKVGVCSKCYGVNFATGKLSQVGDAVGIIAAQSIGEPGTQLTLRTFHVGGTAASISVESKISAKSDGIVSFKSLNAVEVQLSSGVVEFVVMSRSCELVITDQSGKKVSSRNVPYGAYLKVKEGEKVVEGQDLCYWDPYNGVILAEKEGIVSYEFIEEGVTYVEEIDEQSGNRNKIIIESKSRDKSPVIILNSADGTTPITYNIPVKARLQVSEGERVFPGTLICKIPRVIGKSKDITGGLPRVTELLEVRNSSNPAVLAEIDGVVSYGQTRNSMLEVFIESPHGIKKKYLLPLSQYILVQPNDYVKAGSRLSEGVTSLVDLLEIRGLIYIQKHLVNELQDVYRLQGVKINDKHMEVVIYQMMTKVEIVDPGDSIFVAGQLVDKEEFRNENYELILKKVVVDSGDSQNYSKGQLVEARKIYDENLILSRLNKKEIILRESKCAIARPKLRGITKTSLFNESFLSAASFQEVTKILSEAALRGAVDNLKGLKECTITGKLIPAGATLNSIDEYDVVCKNDTDQFTF